jgi:hypothetical protein
VNSHTAAVAETRRLRAIVAWRGRAAARMPAARPAAWQASAAEGVGEKGPGVMNPKAGEDRRRGLLLPIHARRLRDPEERFERRERAGLDASDCRREGRVTAVAGAAQRSASI